MSDIMPRVSNYMVLAIASTIFCCVPLGIVSIVYAAQVNPKLAIGDYDGAVSSSEKAKWWGIISFLIVAIPLGVIFLLSSLGVIKD